MKIDPNEHDEAIYCDSSYGPTFGGGCDIDISILNMKKKQVKQNHFQLDRKNFNWMRLKSIKEREMKQKIK